MTNRIQWMRRLFLVTGASAGLGRATASRLAGMEAHVVMVCRDRARGEAARDEIKSQSKNESVDLMLADLSSLASVRSLAAEFRSKILEVRRPDQQRRHRYEQSDGDARGFRADVRHELLGAVPSDAFADSLP